MSKSVGQKDIETALQDALAQRGVDANQFGAHGSKVLMQGMAKEANQALGHGQGLGHA